MSILGHNKSFFSTTFLLARSFLCIGVFSLFFFIASRACVGNRKGEEKERECHKMMRARARLSPKMLVVNQKSKTFGLVETRPQNKDPLFYAAQREKKKAAVVFYSRGKGQQRMARCRKERQIEDERMCVDCRANHAKRHGLCAASRSGSMTSGQCARIHAADRARGHAMTLPRRCRRSAGTSCASLAS